MKNAPDLIYLLEQQVGLRPELSRCSKCVFVEYIYFTGVVCHAGERVIDANGKCQTHQIDASK
jgi:hypothetical protein